MSVLVFSDAHDKPGTDQLRFTALGNLIAHSRPDVIMQLGDFMTMDSLSRWNVNKRLTMEGVRYKKDIQSARAAIHKLWLPVYQLQCSQKESKKAVYRPQVYWFEGNHECISTDTEVLTDLGWLGATEITSLHNVASVDLETNTIHHARPLDIKYLLNQPMVSVKGILSDELVSENHHLIIDNARKPVLGEVSVSQARFKYASNSAKYYSPSYYGDDDSIFPLQYNTHDILRLLTWVVCDGTIVRRTFLNKRIQFKLSKEHKINALCSLLERMGIKHTVRAGSDIA